MTLLCVLVSVLSLTLSACNGPVVPPERTPTPTLSSACMCSCRYTYSENGRRVPDPPQVFTLAASPPVTADGVVYVAYTIPDATHIPRQDTTAVAALRVRDGLPLWRVPAVNFTEPVAAADGVLIVSNGSSRKLVGLRASDGATLWHSALFAEQVSSSAGWQLDLAPSGGVLYGINSGVAYALRFADGRTLWQHPLPGGLVGTPPVADGTSVYVGASDGSVVALDADTGAIRWAAYTSVTASPMVWHYPLATYGGQLYVRASDAQSVHSAVLRLNVVDGTDDGYALRLPMYAQLQYPALTADIFTTVIYPSVPPGATAPPLPPTLNGYRLSASGEGHLLWSVPGQAGVVRPTAHDAQTFYFAALPPGGIAAYRLTDGVVLWREPALASSGTSMVAGSGYLVETLSGMDAPCHMPPSHQAPQIRALTATQGALAWTRTLDALP